MAVDFTDGNLVLIQDSETIDPTGETGAFASEVAHVGGDKFLVGFVRQLDIQQPGWSPQDQGMRLVQVNNDLTITPGALTAFDTEPIYMGRYRSPIVGIDTNKAMIVGMQHADPYESGNQDRLTAILIDCSGALPTVTGSLQLSSSFNAYMEFNVRGSSQIAVLSSSRVLVVSRGSRDVSHDTAWVELLDVSGAAPVKLAGPVALYVQPNFRTAQVVPVSATTAILSWLDWVDVSGTQRFAPRMQWIDVSGDTIQTENIGYGPGPVVTTVGNPIVHVDDTPGVQADGYNMMGLVPSGPGNKLILNGDHHDGTTGSIRFMQITYNPSDHSSFTINGTTSNPAPPAGRYYTGGARPSAGIIGVNGGAIATHTTSDNVTFLELERQAVFTVATETPLTLGPVSEVSGRVDPLADPNDWYLYDHRSRLDYNPSTGRGLMVNTDYSLQDSSGDEFFSAIARSFLTTYTPPPGGGTGWGSDGVNGNWSVGQIGWH